MNLQGIAFSAVALGNVANVFYGMRDVRYLIHLLHELFYGQNTS